MASQTSSTQPSSSSIGGNSSNLYSTSINPDSIQIGRKRPREVELTRTNRTKARKHHPAIYHGRHFVRVVEMFEHPASIINEGIHRLFNEDDGIEYTHDKASERRYTSFRALEQMMPTLPDDIAETEGAGQEIAAAVAYGCSGSRSDDTGSIKKAIVGWLSESIAASEKPLNPSSKSGRGHHHSVTSKLLTPAALLAEWSTELQKALLDGNALLNGRPVVPADWPAFLYDGPYNPSAPWVGMLRGKLLVTAFKHIFLSPTSATLNDCESDLGDGKGTKSGNAARHGMTSVTPASIAYTAAQVHFALTSHHTFSKTNKAIWSKPLYDSIREYFEDESFQDEHDRLLDWWNQQCFPSSHQGPASLPNTQLEALHAARAAARAAANNDNSPSP